MRGNLSVPSHRAALRAALLSFPLLGLTKCFSWPGKVGEKKTGDGRSIRPSHHAGWLVGDLALDFHPQRIEGVELVERRLRAHAVRILRGLDRLEQQVDLLRGEVQRTEDDLLHLLVTVDRLADHVVGVTYDLRPGRSEQLLRSSE